MSKKKSGAARFSDDDFRDIMRNNPNLKIAASVKANKPNILTEAKDFLAPEKNITTKRKYNIVDVKGIKEANVKAESEVFYGEDYLAIRWHGARMLSVNQIFALLQLSKRKFELFSYKKLWHQMVRNSLEAKENIPFFDSSVELTLFLQSERFVDADAQSVMFKYLIDALKPMKESDEQRSWAGVLSDDNRRIVQSIKPIQILGSPQVGIKIQRIKENTSKFDPNDLFK